MYMFLLIPVLLVLGFLLVFGLPMLPLIALAAVGFAVYRLSGHHHTHHHHGAS